MNTYEELARHHAKHIYTKGAHKGDAPMDKRGKTHLRVIKYPDAYAVRMYDTDILTATPDGRVVLDCNGYIERPTTQKNLTEALRKFVAPGVWVSSTRKFSYSQLVLCVSQLGGRKLYRYYDGITLDMNSTSQEGFVISELRRFQRKQVDKEAVAAFYAGMERSGFKSAFKVLHSVMEWDDRVVGIVHNAMTRVLQDSEAARYWKPIIAKHTFRRYWNWKTGQYVIDKLDASAVWTALMRECKRDMFEVVPTEYTVIDY